MPVGVVTLRYGVNNGVPQLPQTQFFDQEIIDMITELEMDMIRS